jgi:coenzyme Q-binding protein COQ10
MPEHRESRVLPYTQAQMFDLVADVEHYPQFLPWCVACRITSRPSPTEFTADLAVGFKMVREQFSSRVTLTPSSHIVVQYLKGPFQYLRNEWTFTPEGEGVRIDFFLNFEFRSRLLQALIGTLFEEAVRRMVAAFEARARQLYGPR